MQKTIQSLAELNLNIGLYYKDIISFLFSFHWYIVSKLHLMQICRSCWLFRQKENPSFWVITCICEQLDSSMCKYGCAQNAFPKNWNEFRASRCLSQNTFGTWIDLTYWSYFESALVAALTFFFTRDHLVKYLLIQAATLKLLVAITWRHLRSCGCLTRLLGH